ncbi:dephospho-CoA kinase [Reichenbachiella sp. 5M10]|uniref:dephospho-CoA kinase n=1 Tax=Reichenbachiella sp. 5M10 TaxID=1889772 RepID=UPI000C160080|nr:dephospho-CoA kinase [Reichenbachiella sp. 5M10]PIB33953.1 dephospho-CoA kinase [Reichenbachiella sp. 5M10]
MKKIGVTGGIGSGKSTICKIFRTLGIPTYDADSRAKLLMNTNPEIRKKIIASFGPLSYENNQLNRSYLAEKVFTKGDNIQTLNTIVHPVVALDFEEWALLQHSPYVLKEAALLIESGSYQTLDALINVSAPMTLRIQRVKKRDPFRSDAQIQSIIEKQLPEEKRQTVANYNILNGNERLVIPQVTALHQVLSSN